MLLNTVRFARDLYLYLAFQHGQCRGVYQDFHQAEAAAPRHLKLGYNHRTLAEKFRSELDTRLDSSDYPVLFHLAKIIADCHAILDFGGNIGTHYLRYENYIGLEEREWIIWDLPEIVRVGREVCHSKANIRFLSTIDQIKASRIDVFHASGSMQYVQDPSQLIGLLSDMDVRPTHIFIDQIPLYDGATFVTLQSGGSVCYPQYVFNRKEFVAAFENLGYQIADAWSCTHYSCRIPFNRDKSVSSYSGLYFFGNFC